MGECENSSRSGLRRQTIRCNELQSLQSYLRGSSTATRRQSWDLSDLLPAVAQSHTFSRTRRKTTLLRGAAITNWASPPDALSDPQHAMPELAGLTGSTEVGAKSFWALIAALPTSWLEPGLFRFYLGTRQTWIVPSDWAIASCRPSPESRENSTSFRNGMASSVRPDKVS
jgi:hypothetical protein